MRLFCGITRPPRKTGNKIPMEEFHRYKFEKVSYTPSNSRKIPPLARIPRTYTFKLHEIYGIS